MSINDVPKDESTLPREMGQQLPANCRYTAQWIKEPKPAMLLNTPHNRDAAFVAATSTTLPSPELLDYRYGSTILDKWGEKTSGLDRYCAERVPYRPPKAPSTPKPVERNRRTQEDYDRLTQRREGGGSGGAGASGSRHHTGGGGGGAGASGSHHPTGGGGGGAGASGGSQHQARTSSNKLSREEAEAWMMVFHMSPTQVREMVEEFEHSQPDNIMKWCEDVAAKTVF